MSSGQIEPLATCLQLPSGLNKAQARISSGLLKNSSVQVEDREESEKVTNKGASEMLIQCLLEVRRL